MFAFPYSWKTEANTVQQRLSLFQEKGLEAAAQPWSSASLLKDEKRCWQLGERDQEEITVGDAGCEGNCVGLAVKVTNGDLLSALGPWTLQV